MFRHFIFTRFNEGWLDNERLDQSGKPVNNDKWLVDRCNLFEKFCLPSMTGQTNQDFTWLILFDKRTPSHILDKYGSVNNVTIIHENHREWIQNNVKEDLEYLITSRIDNDDAFSTHYVNLIQSVATGRRGVIDTKGFQINLNTNEFHSSGRERRRKGRILTRANSPFLSFVENWKTGTLPDTCYATSHSLMPDKFRSVTLDYYGYCQIVHDACLMNQIVGGPLLRGFIETLPGFEHILKHIP